MNPVAVFTTIAGSQNEVTGSELVELSRGKAVCWRICSVSDREAPREYGRWSLIIETKLLVEVGIRRNTV